MSYYKREQWVVDLGDEFAQEFDELHENGSRHANMKELRFSAADGKWRVASAFNRQRRAILLVAGDKSGIGAKRFYRELTRKTDDRFDSHLARLNKERK